MGSVLVLLVVLGIVYRVTTAEERARLAQAVLAGVRTAHDAVARAFPESEPFRAALRTRTHWVVVTPVLLGANATIFVCMLFGTGALHDPETLIAWGGNFGPRTTNGEWWRLATAMFVHTGLLNLLVNLAGLGQTGMVLERLVGRFAFAALYTGAGVLGHLVILSMQPMGVSAGASGAIFGIHGLLLATLVSGMLYRPALRIPGLTLRRLGPAVALFILYNLAAGLEMDDFVGLGVGLAGGLVLAGGTSDRKPRVPRIAAAMGTTTALAVMIVIAAGVPLRGITDVRPELERVVAVEDRTASAYGLEVKRFTSGRITAEALAEHIELTIVPELQAVRSRIEALDGIPPEFQSLVAAAEEYVQLRDTSWRLRAEGLNQASLSTLREADTTERAALKALLKIRPGSPK